MTRHITAYIELDSESETYIGVVPGVTGAHTFAEAVCDIRDKLKSIYVKRG